MSSLSPPGADSKSIRLLLIEDDPVDVRVLRERLLGEIGSHFEIENCDRLDSAFERLRMRRFDVVLLDLSLPDSDGSATIARLHRAVPDVPIIALTGSNNEEVIESAIRQGAEDYLIKGSVKTDILVRSIGYAIDRKRLRAGLTMERDSALEAARLRTEFLANMSHEIRTPLTGVVGMTWLLIDTELNDDQREMIEIAQQSSKTLLRIVDDILDFSKISAGKMSLEDADFDLSQAVESVMAVFIEVARTKGVALDSMIESDVPCGCAAIPDACARFSPTSSAMRLNLPRRARSGCALAWSAKPIEKVSCASRSSIAGSEYLWMDNVLSSSPLCRLRPLLPAASGAPAWVWLFPLNWSS
jgi:signal transduction histidine kinase